jgi:hypothetical protein
MGPLIRATVCGGVVLLAAAGCGSRNSDGPAISRDPRAAFAQVGEIRQNIQLMLSFDANMDGSVSREEVEKGLRRQFEAADTDHNGSLNLREMQAENARRWQANGTSSSPLIDWNLDGAVSFAEFAGTAQSVFTQLDRDQGGTLAGTELRMPEVRGARRPTARQREGEPRPNRTFRAE